MLMIENTKLDALSAEVGASARDKLKDALSKIGIEESDYFRAELISALICCGFCKSNRVDIFEPDPFPKDEKHRGLFVLMRGECNACKAKGASYFAEDEDTFTNIVVEWSKRF
jgi:hypothetical protein